MLPLLAAPDVLRLAACCRTLKEVAFADDVWQPRCKARSWERQYRGMSWQVGRQPGRRCGLWTEEARGDRATGRAGHGLRCSAHGKEQIAEHRTCNGLREGQGDWCRATGAGRLLARLAEEGGAWRSAGKS